MLTSCPECRLQVSDKALSCPHCGFPLGKKSYQYNRSHHRSHMRLPNGFGQITELRGRNLRKPFRVMVTVGKTDEGRPIAKPLQPVAYFKTYNEAYQALLEYNKSPYKLDKLVTIQELYERWIDDYAKKVCSGNIVTTNSAWKYASEVYFLPVCNVRIPQIKKAILDGSFTDRQGVEHRPSYHNQLVLKKIFNQMFDYAVEYELIDKNYARMFNLQDPLPEDESTDKRPHVSFSDHELNILWGAAGTNLYVDIILVQCYSGWRASELLKLTLSDVDLENHTFLGGSKTAAGKKRIVPIHSKIASIVAKHYAEAVKYGSVRLFNASAFAGGEYHYVSYALYNREFKSIVNRLQLDSNHRTHDCRKTFVTMAKRANVDEYAIKRIIGHQIADLTERVYTDRSIAWLREEIEKIK